MKLKGSKKIFKTAEGLATHFTHRILFFTPYNAIFLQMYELKTAFSPQPLICSLSSWEAWCFSHSAKCILSALQLKQIFNVKEMQCLSSHGFFAIPMRDLRMIKAQHLPPGGTIQDFKIYWIVQIKGRQNLTFNRCIFTSKAIT